MSQNRITAQFWTKRTSPEKLANWAVIRQQKLPLSPPQLYPCSTVLIHQSRPNYGSKPGRKKSRICAVTGRSLAVWCCLGLVGRCGPALGTDPKKISRIFFNYKYIFLILFFYKLILICMPPLCPRLLLHGLAFLTTLSWP
jgi:hypothetical protein